MPRRGIYASPLRRKIWNVGGRRRPHGRWGQGRHGDRRGRHRPPIWRPWRGTKAVLARCSTGEQTSPAQTPLHCTAEAAFATSKPIRVCFAAGADVNAVAIDGRTALHVAAKSGRVDRVEDWLKVRPLMPRIPAAPRRCTSRPRSAQPQSSTLCWRLVRKVMWPRRMDRLRSTMRPSSGVES